MEYSEKIAWLRRYREAVQREETLAQEIEALRCQAARVTQALTGMPGGRDARRRGRPGHPPGGGADHGNADASGR